VADRGKRFAAEHDPKNRGIVMKAQINLGVPILRGPFDSISGSNLTELIYVPWINPK